MNKTDQRRELLDILRTKNPIDGKPIKISSAFNQRSLDIKYNHDIIYSSIITKLIESGYNSFAISHINGDFIFIQVYFKE